MFNIIRVCKKCGEIKDIEEFTKTKNKTHTTFRYTCIECEKKQRHIYNKKYYENMVNKKKTN